MVQTVGLVLHPRRDSASAIQTIVDWAGQHGATVLGLADEVLRIDCSAVPVDTEELAARSSLLVSLGGDGTMLRTMRIAAGCDAPVLGVNLGKLGFLAEIDVDDLPRALSAIDEHRYTVEPRMAVRSALPDGTRGDRVQRHRARPDARAGLGRDLHLRRGAAVRELRGRRGHRGYHDRFHRLQLLGRRPDRLADRRGHPGGAGGRALVVQPGAGALRRRVARASTSFRAAVASPSRWTATWRVSSRPATGSA